MKPEHSYALKKSPHNGRQGELRETLGTKAKFSEFMVGSCTYVHIPVIFKYYEQPIIQYCVEDGEIFLDVYIPKEDMWPDILITKNDLIVNHRDKWDVDFRSNFLRIQKTERDLYFQIDMRGEVVTLDGKFSIGGEEFRFTPQETNVGNITMRDTRVSHCECAIVVGDGRHRLIWPTYAMARPSAIFVKM